MVYRGNQHLQTRPRTERGPSRARGHRSEAIITGGLYPVVPVLGGPFGGWCEDQEFWPISQLTMPKNEPFDHLWYVIYIPKKQGIFWRMMGLTTCVSQKFLKSAMGDPCVSTYHCVSLRTLCKILYHVAIYWLVHTASICTQWLMYCICIKINVYTYTHYSVYIYILCNWWLHIHTVYASI